MLVWVGVAALGGLGAALRFLVDGTISARVNRDFPYGTLAVNITGAVALGLVIGLALAPNRALLAGTATVGAYTTFSTWMFETQRLGEDRQVRILGTNVIISLILGIAAAALGEAIGARL